MWQVVKGARFPNTSVKYWVYLPAGRMFVGGRAVVYFCSVSATGSRATMDFGG